MENLLTGVSFMVIGMSVVFMFLVIMVFSMSILKIVVEQLNKLFPEPVAAGPAKKSAPQNQDVEIAAVIAAAYSAKNKR